VVRRRSRAEIVRLAGLYRVSGMGRSEFCRSQGISTNTLDRYLKKHPTEQRQTESNKVMQSRLVAVELAATVAPVATRERPGALTVLLSNSRRVEVTQGFDRETLAQLITLLEKV